MTLKKMCVHSEQARVHFAKATAIETPKDCSQQPEGQAEPLSCRLVTWAETQMGQSSSAPDKMRV